MSDEPTSGNEAPKYTLTLTFDTATMQCAVTANMPNPDTALDMLARATRAFESQLRFLQAQENMQRAAEQQRMAAVTQNLRRM